MARLLKLVSTIAPAALLAALALLAATGNLLSTSPLAIGLQLGALGLIVWARRSFPSRAFRVSAGPGGDRVIRQGPYRLIRHPMYAGALVFFWVAIVAHPAWWTGLLGLVVTAAAGGRIAWEERLLRERLDGYAEYVRDTK